MSETPAVAAFIAQRQCAVLKRGIDALDATRHADLPEQVHRLVGTFGSYQLVEAQAALESLHDLINSDDPGEVDVEQEKARVLDLLEQALRMREAQA